MGGGLTLVAAVALSSKPREEVEPESTPKPKPREEVEPESTPKPKPKPKPKRPPQVTLGPAYSIVIGGGPIGKYIEEHWEDISGIEPRESYLFGFGLTSWATRDIREKFSEREVQDWIEHVIESSRSLPKSSRPVRTGYKWDIYDSRYMMAEEGGSLPVGDHWVKRIVSSDGVRQYGLGVKGRSPLLYAFAEPTRESPGPYYNMLTGGGSVGDSVAMNWEAIRPPSLSDGFSIYWSTTGLRQPHTGFEIKEWIDHVIKESAAMGEPLEAIIPKEGDAFDAATMIESSETGDWLNGPVSRVALKNGIPEIGLRAKGGNPLLKAAVERKGETS